MSSSDADRRENPAPQEGDNEATAANTSSNETAAATVSQVDSNIASANNDTTATNNETQTTSNNNAEEGRGEEEEDAPFEDANENEFEQYFAHESDDEDDQDDFFFDEDDDDADADAIEVDDEEDAEVDDEYLDDDDIDEESLHGEESEEDEDDFGGVPHLVNNDEYDNVQGVQVNYDTELPSTHNYLGTNFQEVAGSKRVHASNDELELPLLPLPGNNFYENESESAYTQLIPGQVMPVFFYSPMHIQVVRRRMRDNEPTVGFVLSPRSLRNHATNSENTITGRNTNETTTTTTTNKDNDDPKLGILAEIISVSTPNEESSQITDFSSLLESGIGIILKLKGRERFKIVRLRQDITGCYVATVRILPEFVLGDNPLQNQAMRNTEYKIDSFLHKPPASQFKCSSSHAELLNSQLTQPAWLYRYYDCNYLVYSIKRELLETFGQQVDERPQQTTTTASTSTATCLVNDSNDSLVFSYWLLANFPFDNNMRINCLKMDCINHRLIYMYSLLRNFTNISCRKCDNVFCTKYDVFSISKQGFMSAYLNPGGVVHETLTVFKLKNFSMTNARPSTQNTWFPGYGWQICYCGRCNVHIGWKFTPTKPNLKPDKFWGLTRTAIKYTYNRSSEERKDDDTTSANSRTILRENSQSTMDPILAITNNT